MSWAPFVGIFIARISRGRTVRQFILGVLLVPTIVGMIWFGVMGGTGIYEQFLGSGDQVDTRVDDRIDYRLSRTRGIFQRQEAIDDVRGRHRRSEGPDEPSS